MRLLLLIGCALAWAAPARAGEPVRVTTVAFAGHAYDVVEVDLARARLDLVWQDEQGRRLGTLRAARQALERRGGRVVAVTNAGIFGERAPVGLHVEEGRARHPLDLGAGDGNFYLLPNGVFWVDAAGHAAVRESHEYVTQAPRAWLATQSGPLLVRAGRLHPRFVAGSANRLLRSGVGVRAPDRVVLAISHGGVSFDDFARLFRDRLGCRDALYLDGTISRLDAPPLAVAGDAGGFMGMLVVSVPATGAGAADQRRAR